MNDRKKLDSNTEPMNHKADENMKKLTSKVAHNWPNFFSAVPTVPKPAQISISVPQKMLTLRLMYNDFFTRLKDCRLKIWMAGMTSLRTIFTLAAHQKLLGQISPI